MIDYTVTPARHSSQAAFPVKIVYADFRMIGTHEERVPEEVEWFVNEILAKGYNWPPIAVLQAGSDEWFKTADDNARLDGLKFGEIGVADGHHRFAAMEMLGICGLLPDSYIPVQLVPAHDAAMVRIVASAAELPLPIADIEAKFPNPSNKFPTVTSHFQARLTTGEWVPIRQSQPDMSIKLEHLLKSARRFRTTTT